jgi:hypothetical protein
MQNHEAVDLPWVRGGFRCFFIHACLWPASGLPLACLWPFLPMATQSPGERKDDYFIFGQELEKNQ